MIPLRDKHDFSRAIENHLRSLRGRIRGLATRFVLGKSSKQTGDLARVRGETYAGDATDDDELIQNYGFASMPVNGAEGVRISVFSDGDHGVVIVCDDRRYRPTLVDGEVATYHKDGAVVHLKTDGSITIIPSSTGARQEVHIGADAAAEFVALSDKVATELTAIKDAFDAHTHAAGFLVDSTANPCTGTTAAPTAMPTPGSVAATKVKAT